MGERFPGLFEVYGVELEYMVVSASSLDVLPVVDRLLTQRAGELVSEVDCGTISWSNELALHVLEFKTSQPAGELAPLSESFQQEIRTANQLLAPFQARLMRGGMHPWMDPEREMQLWPHDYSPVYEAYNRIFDCRGHGWANLQSVHLNLPFADDEQFGRLHAAIRLILPILPALAASSPIVERQLTPWLDNRLEFYRHNARRIPSISGGVIPEPVMDGESYRREILQKMYDDIRAEDPQGTLQHEWLNSRGAIARFGRQTIEIRVLDVQECPELDLALLELIVAVLQDLVAERWSTWDQQLRCEQPALENLFLEAILAGRQASVTDSRFLEQWPAATKAGCIGELWQALLEQVEPRLSPAARRWCRAVLERGSLAERIRSAVQAGEPLEQLYGRLCDCLAQGQPLGL